jgi:uncharacterized protein
MADVSFEWDARKNRANQKKHGVSFEEARTAFFDEHARVIADPEHSEDEDRFVLLGLSAQLRVLVVCHCYRASDQVVRIISARRASPSEQHHYAEHLP